MDGTNSGRARTPNYQREHGMLGALITFGRAGLDAARAAGWTPDLARRPQIAALGAWLAEGIEARPTECDERAEDALFALIVGRACAPAVCSVHVCSWVRLPWE